LDQGQEPHASGDVPDDGCNRRGLAVSAAPMVLLAEAP
jgi:hypothetical protein